MASTIHKGSFLLVLIWFLIRAIHAKPGLCETENGQSNIILGIEESRDSYSTQETFPAELPIVGEPNVEIFLDLIFPKGPPIFFLNGKKMQLLHSLDRDEENLSHIVFQLVCTVKSSRKKRTIPVIVRLTDINDNAPQFVNTPYETSISELTPVGTTIFQNILAKDKDASTNGLVEYSIVEGNNLELNDDENIVSEDGYGYFSIPLPHLGHVIVNRTLDYERTQRYYVTIVATDKAKNVEDRLSATTTLTVNVKDDDDQSPSFVYDGCMLLDGACINPEYTSSVSSGVLHGILNVFPEKIRAVDLDTVNSAIRYSFVSGSPKNFGDFFRIDPETGTVHQIRAVDTSMTKRFSIIIKAQEVSEAKRSTTAKLFVIVKPVDANPPEIIVSAIEGFVNENSPIGTSILDGNGRKLKIEVVDKDFGPDDIRPTYSYELTTDAFTVDKHGFLVVNDNNLDRDPPNPGRFKFQIVAREQNSTAASAPTSLTVTLNDVNDNAPIIPLIPPQTVPAGDVSRYVTIVNASDIDDNSKLTYSIYHVSNGGTGKFRIDPTSGRIVTVGKINAGELYSLTVQATDEGGLYGQAIVEVRVTRGPNTESPVFEQSVYNVDVSEGATVNSTVATITATDPEDDPVTYSIVSGNDLGHFSIDRKTGILIVKQELDREIWSNYTLTIRAEDTGNLSSISTANIRVTDINDKNPVFLNSPYNFTVVEGVNASQLGFVKAIDADDGINAVVTYSIPENVPFVIDKESGEIKTSKALDYEEQKNYQFVVTAKDGATDPRIATATVSVGVVDVEDELPVFNRSEYYYASVAENLPEHFVTKVEAFDADTVKKVTYVIQQGPTDLFRIDDTTGAVYTTRGLDYEKENVHVLIIGTLENMSNNKGSTTKVIVNVEDRNDIPPVFTLIPHPITLDDDVSIGTSVTNLVATDSDGTAPGNKVRYEIVGRGKATKYFQIDPDTGIVKVTNDLKKEIDSEYQVDVRAYDLGEPQLSSVITLDIFIQHVATVAPEIGMRFADTSFSVQVPENSTIGRLLKILTIVNTQIHDGNIPLKCEIILDDKYKKEKGIFMVNVTEDRNCALYLNSTLDYEKKDRYELKVQLMSLQGYINKDYRTAEVIVSVLDVNDNSPYIIYPDTSSNKSANKLYAALSRDVQIGTTVTQIKADDDDNGKYGKVSYSIDGDKSHFMIEPTSGIVRSKRTFDDLDQNTTTFRLIVKVRDNPNSTIDYHQVNATLIVNLIGDANRLILVIGDAKPEVVAGKVDTVVGVIEEQSGLIVGVETMRTREFVGGNGTLETDPSATDVWFYVIDPETDEILTRNHSLVQRSILDKSAMDNITFDITGQIKCTATEIHEPIIVPKMKATSIASFNGEVFPYALIIIACIIFVFGVVGIIYICISWSRYKNFKDQMQRSSYMVPSSPTRYDTVYVEPNLKEYETQVLQMSVPVDDQDDGNDLHLDFSSNKSHVFSLDNVSYISKENLKSHKYGGQSPVSSETTARASSVGEGVMGVGRVHHLYHRSSDEEDMNTSPTNENVMFREKKDYSHLGYPYGDRSPVETTTEL